jgi:hypothetical protein
MGHETAKREMVLTGQSDAERSVPIRAAIDEARAHRELLIAAGVNRHERRKRARLERAKP